ncbi:MAG: hypothetical protein PHE53_13515 [Thermoguttaceae bacterium]|nr:hypothetical protein [Thermoguttaceae bacterium]
MRCRRRRQTGGSLELLLDTICNTFGGIVFLAMLVIVLLRSSDALPGLTGAKHSTARQLEMTQLRQQLAEVTSEIDAYEVTRQSAEQLQQTLFSPEELQAWQTLLQLRREKKTLTAEIARLDSSVKSLGTQADSLDAEQKSQAERLAELRRQLASLQEELVKLRQQHTIQTELPRLRLDEDKTSVVLVLRFGRVYFWHRPEMLRQGKNLLNLNDFVVVGETVDGIVTLPNPMAGFDLTQSTELTQLTDELKKFPQNKWYLSFCVWDDSFKSFRNLKNIAVQMGFTYQTTFGSLGGAIIDRGGQRAYVQ